MNESIFEGNLFGNGSIAGTPADEDVEEFIDIPEADDESSSEGDTPGGNILELLSRMRGLMPNSDGDEDMCKCLLRYSILQNHEEGSVSGQQGSLYLLQQPLWL